MSGAPRVAVVGAGLAGLAAGLELRRDGARVELFERTRLLGGKATSFTAGGVEVDSGQHVFLACFDQWRALVRELGLEGALHLQPRFEARVLARDGRSAVLRAARLPSPWHLAPALLANRLLGWRGRLQVAVALLAARRPASRELSFERWLDEQGQGHTARAAFWEPFLVPALNAPLGEVSAEAGCFVLRTAFLGEPGACRVGWSKVPLARIAEAAAARLDAVHLRSAVAGLELRGGRLAGLRLANGELVECAGAVLAVPPAALGRLLGEPERFAVRGLDRIREQPIVDVHLWYDRPDLGIGFAALAGSPVQWVFEKGPGYLCCSLSAAGAHVRRPEAELVELCHRELAAVLPALRGLSPLRGRATRDPSATFVQAPGLRRPGAATAVPNLALAGAWTETGWPATMESAVRSGRAAARLLGSWLAGERAAAAAAEAVAS